MKRDKREKIFDFFDFEIIFAHDIEFFDVIIDVIDANKTNDFIEFVENEKRKIDDINIENAKINETNEINNAIVIEINFSRFACFVRTCS